MGFAQTILIYLVIGAVVGATNVLLRTRESPLQRALAFAASIPFWPLLAPFMMSRQSQHSSSAPCDLGLDDRIEAAEARLIATLKSLDGVAEEVLAPEVARVRGLGQALRTMARRSAEMAALLTTQEFSRERAVRVLEELEHGERGRDDPRLASVRARVANIERLEGMQARTTEGLERALLEVEEIGSRMALLRFADHREEEVVRLIRDIAASVEGVSALCDA